MSHFIVNVSQDHATRRRLPNSGSRREVIEYINNDLYDRMSVNDGVITLSKNQEYYFDYSGFVFDKPVTELLSQGMARLVVKNMDSKLKYYRHKIPVEIETEFKSYNTLDDYTYSLKSISNYLKPYSHLIIK